MVTHSVVSSTRHLVEQVARHPIIPYEHSDCKNAERKADLGKNVPKCSRGEFDIDQSSNSPAEIFEVDFSIAVA